MKQVFKILIVRMYVKLKVPDAQLQRERDRDRDRQRRGKYTCSHYIAAQ